MRRLLSVLVMLIAGGMLAGCGGGTSAPQVALPLDEVEPTVLYFYTDN